MDIHIEESFDKAINSLSEIKDFLEKLYTDQDVNVFFQKPLISMLITACEYLQTNLSNIKITLDR